MTLICQALADEHPVHGADLVSYRTAEDMAYEWQQHNIAYQLLSDDSPFRNNVNRKYGMFNRFCNALVYARALCLSFNGLSISL